MGKKFIQLINMCLFFNKFNKIKTALEKLYNDAFNGSILADNLYDLINEKIKDVQNLVKEYNDLFIKYEEYLINIEAVSDWSFFNNLNRALGSSNFFHSIGS